MYLFMPTYQHTHKLTCKYAGIKWTRPWWSFRWHMISANQILSVVFPYTTGNFCSTAIMAQWPHSQTLLKCRTVLTSTPCSEYRLWYYTPAQCMIKLSSGENLFRLVSLVPYFTCSVLEYLAKLRIRNLWIFPPLAIFNYYCLHHRYLTPQDYSENFLSTIEFEVFSFH